MPNALLGPMTGASAPGTNMSPGGPAAAGPGAGGQPMPGAGAAQPQVSIDQVKQGIMRQSQLDHRLRTLLESGKPVDRKDAVNMCVGLVADRIFTAEEMAGYLTTLPTDPTQVRDWIAKHADSVEQGLDKMMAMIHGQDAPPQVPQMPDAADAMNG